MDVIKKEICFFSDYLINDIPGGEKIILDSFATMYISLKKLKKTNLGKYRLLDIFFKNLGNLGVIPQIDKKGNVIYKKRNIEGKNKIDKKQLKKEMISVFGKGEETLINDLFLNSKKKIIQFSITLDSE